MRIGFVNGSLVVNPTIDEMAESSLDLRVAGTKDAILMVEAGANEVTEVLMVEALQLAHESIQPIIALQEQMAAEVGKAKQDVKLDILDKSLVEDAHKRVLTG